VIEQFVKQRTKKLVVAAGKLTGCDTVHHPVENLQMLESGRTQLATAQADISPEPRARALAVL
jgi:hypothetical protein